MNSRDQTIMLRPCFNRLTALSLAVSDTLSDARYLAMHENDARPPHSSLPPPRSKAAVPEMLSMSEYVWLDLKNPGYQSSYPESYFP